MTPAPAEDRAETAPDPSTAHDKAVDMMMGDRAMISRLLREHQMLHEVFEHGPVACALHDAAGALVLSNPRHDRLTTEAEAGDHRAETGTLPSGMTVRLAVPIGAEKAREAELVRERDAALAADRAKDDFLASMSHEIRTPMNGLMGMAGLLAESGLSQGQQMYAYLILRSGRALLDITNDILDLSKLEAGRVTLNCEPFDIGDSIEETATLFSANADAKGLDLIVRVDPAMPRLLVGDGNRLRQIVANLVGNAIKFTEAGHVMVDVSAMMGAGAGGGRIARLTCRVQDTGSGIAPHMCERIFERFSQADRIAHRAQEGTGLGLAIVAALVDEMGGTVGVESVEGAGTTFRFTVDLPVATPDAPRMAREDLKGRRVMIVDGEGPCRAILAESLRGWGFDVAPCRGVREGMALMDAMEARSRDIDLVLLGERVAEGDASLFMAALAGREEAAPPVIVIARLAALTRHDGSGEGAAPFDTLPFDTLPRPVRSTYLLASMERALGERAPLSAMATGVAEEPEAPARAQEAPPKPQTTPALLPGPKPVLRIEGPVATPIAEPESARIDILVADDNEINRLLIEEILREGGYSYRIVPDGVEAVAAWRAHRPRLILMDVSMPRMGGEDATRAIRSEERPGTRTPVVALTAHALRGDRDRCMGAGMDDHLTKPLTIASITRTIDFHLRPAVADAAG